MNKNEEALNGKVISRQDLEKWFSKVVLLPLFQSLFMLTGNMAADSSGQFQLADWSIRWTAAGCILVDTLNSSWMYIGRYLEQQLDVYWSIPWTAAGCILVDTLNSSWMYIGRYLEQQLDVYWSNVIYFNGWFAYKGHCVEAWIM